MAVPTYQRILDSEIDPESPITASLLQRFRNNLCALFNIDPATVTPSASFQPSTLRATNGSVIRAQANGTTVTSGEIIVSEISSAMEQFLPGPVSPPEDPPYASGRIPYHFFTLFQYTGAYDTIRYWSIRGVTCTYASGVPISVTLSALALPALAVPMGYTESPVINANGDFSATIPVDSAFHVIYSTSLAGSGGTLEMKARADASFVYLSFRFGGYGPYNTFIFDLRIAPSLLKFVAK